MKKTNLAIYILSAMLLGAMTIACSKSESAGDGNYNSNPGSSESGTGGSMARFTICGDYIYTIDNYSYEGAELKIARIADAANPREVGSVSLRINDVETIFPYDNKLFIGSRSGMYIYDLSADPENPQQLSFTRHFTACDPVVACGDYAYVTLSNAGNVCNRSRNALIIYDITDLKAPTEVREYDFQSTVPQGLGVDGPAGLLFVCTNYGVKVYDLTDPSKPTWKQDLTHISGAGEFSAYDVITLGGLLIVIGPDGLYQFDYTGEEIEFVSSIKLKGEE